MNNLDDGGPAFPDPARAHPQGHPNDANGDGMTLWDYYAAAALQGIASNPTAIPYEEDAESAGRFADAMLAERRKRFADNSTKEQG